MMNIDINMDPSTLEVVTVPQFIRVSSRMACLHNSSSSSSSSQEQSSNSNKCPPMSPRISFSNDFAETKFLHQQVMRNPSKGAPPSSDFEFSVSNMATTSTADELFFKGQFLPFKPTHKPMTLREELLVEEEGDLGLGVSHRPPKTSSTRWKGLLGLNKSHIGSKMIRTTKPSPPPTSHAFDFTGAVE